jgi:hypothetical protein
MRPPPLLGVLRDPGAPRAALFRPPGTNPRFRPEIEEKNFFFFSRGVARF